eukprot:1159199-Pelagomonas_calceolata.AAC.7
MSQQLRCLCNSWWGPGLASRCPHQSYQSALGLACLGVRALRQHLHHPAEQHAELKIVSGQHASIMQAGLGYYAVL